MKKCNRCNEERDLSYFKKSSKSKDGHIGTCKICQYGHEPHKKATIDKKCKLCLETKPVEDFPFINKERQWYDSRCKKCNNKRLEILRSSTKERKRKTMLRKNYGISLETYDNMYKNQKGCCVICKTTQESLSKPLNVDHCHTTGIIRGLLCSNCNSGLGFFKDNIESLQEAIKYLLNVKKP